MSAYVPAFPTNQSIVCIVFTFRVTKTLYQTEPDISCWMLLGECRMSLETFLLTATLMECVVAPTPIATLNSQFFQTLFRLSSVHRWDYICRCVCLFVGVCKSCPTENILAVCVCVCSVQIAWVSLLPCQEAMLHTDCPQNANGYTHRTHDIVSGTISISVDMDSLCAQT